MRTKFKPKKLVRDQVPDNIRANHGDAKTRTLNDEEFKKQLILKLKEETKEFEISNNIWELADIYEVFKTLVSAYGYTLEGVIDAANIKERHDGAFKNRIFLESYTKPRRR